MRQVERPPGDETLRWVPLIIAPHWSETHPERAATRPGPELAREFFTKLTKRDLPEGA